MAAVHKNESAIPSLEGGEEKPMAIPLEDNEDLQALAAKGHVATDQYVRLRRSVLLLVLSAHCYVLCITDLPAFLRESGSASCNFRP